jgi:hypothetical protein
MKGVFIILLLVLFISACSSEDVIEDNQTVNNSTNITQNETVTLSPEPDEVNETEEIEPIIQVGTCHDSDDGKAYGLLGYVRLNNTGNLDYMDSCISDLNIREYYCDEDNPGNLAFEVHPCTDICENGVCTVEDSDNETNSTD